MGEELLVHYWQLPQDLYINLKDETHQKLCKIIQDKLNNKHKNCFHQILNCPKWHAKRIFTKFNRFTIKELEVLRRFAQIPEQEIENNIICIGNQEDGSFIKNPKLPFKMQDIFYIASHLFFDGSYREKKGCYFYSYEDSLTEYHKKRLSTFGEVPTNFIASECQLYFSYTIGYIASKVLNINTFNSTECFLSNKMKFLAKKYKTLVDEIIKAMIIDEGSIDDKIKVELANEKLTKDLCEIISLHYKLGKLSTRTRKNITFKENPSWTHDLTSWYFCFSSEGFKDLYSSLSPLPISYKQENLEVLYSIKTRNWKHRKHHGDTQKSIVLSLLQKSKTLSELSRELCMPQKNISRTIKKIPAVLKVGEIELRKGGYAKANIFGIKDIQEARKFLVK